MINFLPISILAYALNGGTAVIDKILLNKILPSPFVYAFYGGILGFLSIFFVPFGFQFSFESAILGGLSGIFFVLALLTYFQSLKTGEASVVTPVVGSFNPLFTLIIGFFFLNQALSQNQLLAFAILILGSLVLTFNLIKKHLRLNKQLNLMILSGFLFALSYVLLALAFTFSNFITGLVIKSVTGAIFVTGFLFFPKIKAQIFSARIEKNNFANKTSILLIIGQVMGGVSGFLLSYAISLANPALVNSLFGVQYLIILAVALFLAKEHHAKLLGENLSKGVLVQKIIGAGILSFGVYLLSK